MKLFRTCSFLIITAALASCGGKSKGTSAVGNSAGGGAAASPIPLGIHGCHFIIDGDAYGQHRCDVTDEGGTLRVEKKSGMETFSATATPMANGVHLKGDFDCGVLGPDCNHGFEAHLTNQGGSWQGTVEPTGEGQTADNWWIASSTFVLDDAAGYGGATYGEAFDEPMGD